MKRTIYFFLLFFPSIFVKGQMLQLNAAEIAQGIAKLNNNASVLYIAAHPDDENTRLLAYLSKEVKVRTGYLSLTRGDGGQNLIGNEQAELLGLIRTQELLAARRIDGAEQFFTRANDFGFSKTADESFKIWGKEQILADVVWVIRKFRPDVIITRFPEDSRAGHGHHAGSAILAREAFAAAADAKRFPEQLKYVKTWQAKRILWNTFNFGGNNTTAADQLKIDVGLYNPLLGKSYGEIAAISRTNHKSQGFGAALQRGESLEYFSPVAGSTATSSLFDGIKIGIGNAQIEILIASIQKNYQLDQPWQSLTKLLELKKATQNISFNHKLLDELILACAGIWVEANAPENSYAAGDSIPFKVQAIARIAGNFPLNISLSSASQKTIDLKPNQLQVLNQKMVSSEADLTQPYWLGENHPIGQFNIPTQQDVGYPENPSQLSAKLYISLNGQQIEVNTPIIYKYTDPIRGEVYQPLIIAPPVTASMSEKSYIFTGSQTKSISVKLKNFANHSKGSITPVLPKGWNSSPTKIDFDLTKKGDEQQIDFQIQPGGETNSGQLLLQLNIAGKTYDKSLKTISYEHIPNISLFPKAIAKLEKVDLKMTGKRIAYIEGAGDLVADALKQIGYEVSHLDIKQLGTYDLSNFDAIVIGVRFYNVNTEARNVQAKLLNYVKNGGTLLVQYNVNNGLKLSEIGPYPFSLSNKRVTEEDAKVNFLLPSHPALNYPNKITAADFEGWVQERGLYFASSIDPQYSMPLAMNDLGEESNNGSLLIANYGQGKFVYTSLAFFRELPAGVPGAYRLFVNLLAKKQP